MRFAKTALVAAVLLFPRAFVEAGAPGELYQVKAGETLSHIADTIKSRNPGSRIYGRRGILAQLLELNSHITDPNLILVRQEIRVTAPITAGAPASARAPSRAPAAETAPKEEEPASAAATAEDEVPFGAKFALDYRFTNLYSRDKATGASADLRSKTDLRAGVAVEQDWGDGFGTFFGFGLRRVDFEPPTNAAKALRMESKSLADLSAGATHRISDRLMLKLSVNYAKQLFLRGLSSNALSVDAIAVPELSAGLGYDFYRRGNTVVAVEGSGAYVGGGNTDTYDVKSGYGYGASLGFDRRYGEKTISLRAGYRRREQATTFIELHESSVYGAVLFSLPLFGGK